MHHHFLIRFCLIGNLFLFLADPAVSQTSAYTPIKASGPLPEELTHNINAAAKAKAEAQSVLPKAQADALFLQVEIEKRKLFSGGKIYFADELNTYLQQVMAKLLNGQAEQAQKYKIYAFKSEEVNAHSLPDGTILVSLGLLQKLENEAQLAAIIAHEIAHIELQHTLKGLQRQLEQKEERGTEGSWLANSFNRLRYSRENENEADARGLSLLAASPYTADAAPRAFALLVDSANLKIGDRQPINYAGLLKELKPVSDSALAKYRWPGNEGQKNKTGLMGEPTDITDQYSSHPDMEKRVLALREILGLIEYKSGGKALNLLPAGTTASIRKTSRYELVQHLYQNSQFGKSLFYSLQLLNEFPADKFLLTLVAKNLYWIGHYREINNNMAVLSDDPSEEQPEYKRLMASLLSLNEKELKSMNFRFMKEHLEANRKHDDFFYYYALTTEALLGKEAARLIYQQYQVLHPTGLYQTHVQRKLQS